MFKNVLNLNPLVVKCLRKSLNNYLDFHVQCTPKVLKSLEFFLFVKVLHFLESQ